MAQLFDITRVVVGSRNLTATVVVAPDAPLYTDEDPEGTELVLGLMPELADHVCLGDASGVFGEVVAQTELAHLLEHVSVELLARTNIAGDVTCGQTREVGARTYEVTLACPDDLLVAGALSSAVWILQWAYSGGGDPEPNVDAIASGLVDLVGNLVAMEKAAAELDEQDASADGPAAEAAPADEPEPEPASVQPALTLFDAADGALDAEFEPIGDDGPDLVAVPAGTELDQDVPAEPDQTQDGTTTESVSSRWDLDDVPRPRPVR